MKDILLYSAKVWFTSIIPIPLIDQFLYNYERNFIPLKFWEIAGFWDYVVEDFIIGIYMSFFSIPIFIIFFLINNEIQKQVKTIFQLKVCINILSIIVNVSVSLFLFYSEINFLSMCILQTLLIWMLKIKPIKNKSRVREDILDDGFHL